MEEQVKQLEKVKETHNIKNINNCVSLDEISVVINSTPRYGWFEKNKEPNYKIENPTNKQCLSITFIIFSFLCLLQYNGFSPIILYNGLELHPILTQHLCLTSTIPSFLWLAQNNPLFSFGTLKLEIL